VAVFERERRSWTSSPAPASIESAMRRWRRRRWPSGRSSRRPLEQGRERGESSSVRARGDRDPRARRRHPST
jgi:hypothetical protein